MVQVGVGGVNGRCEWSRYELGGWVRGVNACLDGHAHERLHERLQDIGPGVGRVGVTVWLGGDGSGLDRRGGGCGEGGVDQAITWSARRRSSSHR